MAPKTDRLLVGNPTRAFILILAGLIAVGVIFFLSISAATQKNVLDLRSRAVDSNESPLLAATIQQMALQNLESLEDIDGSRGVVRERADEAQLSDTTDGLAVVRQQIHDRVSILTALQDMVNRHTDRLPADSLTESTKRIGDQIGAWQNIQKTVDAENDPKKAVEYYRPFMQLSRIFAVFEPRERVFINWAILTQSQRTLVQRIDQSESAFRNATDDPDGTVYEQTQVLLEQSRIRNTDINKQLLDLKTRILAITPQSYEVDPDGVVILFSQLQADLSELQELMRSTFQTMKLVTANLTVLAPIKP